MDRRAWAPDSIMASVDPGQSPANFAGRHGVVGVVAGLGGEVKCKRKARLAVVQQKLEALVRFLCASKSAVLAHGPKALPVHVGVQTPGVVILARLIAGFALYVLS